MAISQQEKTSPYEVRCPRCDVSFPTETRQCIHCGGPTGKPGQVVREEPSSLSESGYSIATHSEDHYGIKTSSSTPDSMSHEYQDNVPIEPVADSPFSTGGSIGGSIRDAIAEVGRGGDQQNERELETSDGPPSIVGSLVRSLGGFVWVILLIGISIWNNCQN
jgi:hypothetical protein